jgi:hypothetical protein
MEKDGFQEGYKMGLQDGWSRGFEEAWRQDSLLIEEEMH